MSSETQYRRDDPQLQREQMLEGPLPSARADLMISPQLYLGRNVYVVKDPVRLSYFRIKPVEHFVLSHLNGAASANELAEQASRAFPDHPITPDEVLNFVQMLKNSGLLMGHGGEHGWWLREMARLGKKRRRTAQSMNFLFIRLPLVDPDRLLNVLYDFFSPFMNRTIKWVLIAFMCVSLIAGLWELQRVGDLAFPILSFTNLLLLTVVFFGVKIIHEFGHGLAAKLRGLEVHEMGVLMMVFWPMFYIDTSDAWMLPRRSDRLWINAGGIFTEFLFASVAVWVWLLTEPGLVNQIAFNTMLAASITTFLFNANPLLRYDGYYFLMDYLEIPNLKTKASRFVGYLAQTYLLGMKDQRPPEEASRKPLFMPIYSAASALYRWLIVFFIVALVWHVLDPYGLETIGALMGFAAIVTMVLLPMGRMLQFVWRQRAAIWRRLAVCSVAAAALGAIAVGLLSIPIEHSVEYAAVILAPQRRPLYAPASGRVEEVLVEPGERIEEGEPILRLTDDRLRDRLQTLRIKRKQTRLDLRLARLNDRQAQRVALTKQLDVLERRIEHVKQEIEKRIIRAPITGRLKAEPRLPTLIGARLHAGQKLGVMIGSGPRRLMVLLPQSEAALVEPHMPVRARLWALADHILHGRVQRIGARFAKRLPHPALASIYGGAVDIARTSSRRPVPTEAYVLAQVDIKTRSLSVPLLDGMTGRGKIIVGRSSLGAQQWNNIRQALSLDWWL